MSDTTFTLADMIHAAREESPSEFQTVFANLIQQKVVDTVDAERQVVAQNYFNSDQEDNAQDDANTVQPEDTNDENAETNN